MTKQLQFYLALGGVFIVSLVIGNALAEGNYVTPVVMVLLSLIVTATIVQGYGLFLAFGLLCPFTFMIPYVYRFPFFAVVLGLCCAKFAVSEGLSPGKFHYRFAANFAVGLFFAWVMLRYCMNPVKPGIAVGTGSAITGFRAYFNYGICLVLILTFPLFIRTRDDALSLLRWLGVISLVFALLFIPLTLTKSLKLARALTNLGLTPMFFDNGWLRFVSLPGFGLILLTLCLLPNVMPLRQWQRILVLIISFLAIVMGGNRSSLALAMIVLICIAFIRGNVRLIALVTVSIAVALTTFYFLGESMQFKRGVGFFRVLALVSPRAAERSEASQTVLWRRLRWERAVQDIKAAPWVGVGYGGLKGIFAYATIDELQENLVEIDVASGSVHNGYLAGARAFGIPFLVLYLVIIASRLYRHAKEARAHRTDSPSLSEMHTFVFATLSALVIASYVGLDLNAFEIWFYVALSFVLSGLGSPLPPARQAHAEPVAAPTLRSATLARH
jgi:hypothetical protein